MSTVLRYDYLVSELTLININKDLQSDWVVKKEKVKEG